MNVPAPHRPSLSSRRMRQCRSLVATLLLLGSAAAVATPLVIEYRIVELPANHLSPTWEHLKENGAVVWQGSVSDGDIRRGVFEVQGTVVAVHTDDDPVPLRPGVTFENLQASVWKNNRFVILSTLTGTGVSSSNDQAVYMTVPGSGLQEVVTEGDAAPGLPGLSFGVLDELRLNRQGRACFGTDLGGAAAGEDLSLWCSDLAALPILMAREGEQAPGRPPGELFTDLTPLNSAILEQFSLDDLGNVFFLAATGQGMGLWRVGPSGDTLLAFEGGGAPGTVLTTQRFDLLPPRPTVGTSGGASFCSLLGDMSGPIGVGCFVGVGRSPRLAALYGDPLPAGGSFAAPALRGVHHSDLAVLLDNPPIGSDSLSVEQRVGASIQLFEVAVEDAPAPNAGPLDEFRSLALGLTPYDRSGRVFFAAEIGADGFSERDSLWVWDPTCGPVLIADVGGAIDFGDLDVRTVLSLRLLGSGRHDGWRHSYNRASQVAFFATFTDASAGIVVASVDPLVYDDGFESGNVSSWSSSSP